MKIKMSVSSAECGQGDRPMHLKIMRIILPLLRNKPLGSNEKSLSFFYYCPSSYLACFACIVIHLSGLSDEENNSVAVSDDGIYTVLCSARMAKISYPTEVLKNKGTCMANYMIYHGARNGHGKSDPEN